MTSGVVLGFESVYIDIGSHELSAGTQRAIDLALDGSQPGPPAAHSCQLVGPGILTVLGGLGAIVRRNLAIAAGLGAVGRGLGARRSCPGSVRCRILTVARRSQLRLSVGLVRRIVIRVRLPVAHLGRDVPLLRGLCAIVRCNLAVVDGLCAVVRSLSAPRGGPGTFVCRMLTVARRAASGGSVENISGVVMRVGLSVTQRGRDVTLLRGLGAVVRGSLAIAAGLHALVRGLSAPRGGPGTFVCRVLTVARRAIPCGSVEITRRVVTRFGLSVTQLGRDVTLLRSHVASSPLPVALTVLGQGLRVCPRGPQVLGWAFDVLVRHRFDHAEEELNRVLG